MGRTDCCQNRNYGNKVFAGDVLCGTWPAGAKNDWVEFNCPAGTKASEIRVVQPKKTALTLCGMEVFGQYLGVPTNATKTKRDDSKDEKLDLTGSSESGVDKRWPWRASKVVDAKGSWTPDISKKDHTCTHSNFVPGNW